MSNFALVAARSLMASYIAAMSIGVFILLILYIVTIKTAVAIYDVCREFSAIAVFNNHAHSNDFTIIVFKVDDVK